jgi:single-strand DNA-binding protein
MNGLNKIYLLGYLGRDPELCTTKAGAEYAKISIATRRTTKAEDGTYGHHTDWHTVSVWGRKAQLCMQMARKGSVVMVEGTLTVIESTTPEGRPMRSPWITAREIEFVRPSLKAFSAATSGPNDELTESPGISL